MHPVFYYLLVFMAIGAIGMGAGSRKVTPAVRWQRWLKLLTYILITGIIVTAILRDFFFWIAIVIAGLALLELVLHNRRHFLRNKKEVFCSSLVFILFAAGFLMFACCFSSGFLVFIYFQVLIFDGFCQVTGQLWGRRRLLPSISPEKTVEGLVGGWICCIIAAGIAANWVPLALPVALTGGLLTGFTSFCGDTLSSFYKRRLGIKDYSSWLPGQGGFLDRFDSLLVTGFVYYIAYLLGFVNPGS